MIWMHLDRIVRIKEMSCYDVCEQRVEKCYLMILPHDVHSPIYSREGRDLGSLGFTDGLLPATFVAETHSSACCSGFRVRGLPGRWGKYVMVLKTTMGEWPNHNLRWSAVGCVVRLWQEIRLGMPAEPESIRRHVDGQPGLRPTIGSHS